jgi:hypothetical protein
MEHLCLHDILLGNPKIVDDEKVTVGDILKDMKTIDKFLVVRDWEDDRVQSYEVQFTIEGKTHNCDFMWLGEGYERMFYQSEINADILDRQLRPFLAARIIYEIELSGT